MTDEELAKERATKFADINFNEPDNYGSEKEVGHFSYAAGFLAGLAAGRPEWHKVADGDYPPCEKGSYSINVLTDSGDIAYYDYDDGYWIEEPASVEIDTPIAWCEIPKYIEED